jgi:glycosyltransferase involved in cell wall biosynthesis
VNATIHPRKLERLRPVAEFPRKVAIVHDWLPEVGGAERVLGEIINVLPEADLFSLLDFIPSAQRGFLKDKPVRTSFLQKLPGIRRFYRFALPLMPLAVETFDLSRYDLILSSSYAVAKGVLSGPDQLHLCYCHSPMRYAWDLQEQYLRQTGMESGGRGFAARALLHYMRLWDCRTPNGVDAFAANSEFISRRIWKVYRRRSTVIFPPVGSPPASSIGVGTDSRRVYVSLGRLVPYKRVDLLVEAFRKMPERNLHIIGDGPERARLERSLPDNVRLLGRVSESELWSALRTAKGLVFAAEEDFGIALVEAQAAGTPVIAYGRGGASESVLHGVTGVLFQEQSVEGIVAAVEAAENAVFEPENFARNVRRFSPEIFRSELSRWIKEHWDAFVRKREGVQFE